MNAKIIVCSILLLAIAGPVFSDEASDKAKAEYDARVEKVEKKIVYDKNPKFTQTSNSTIIEGTITNDSDEILYNITICVHFFTKDGHSIKPAIYYDKDSDANLRDLLDNQIYRYKIIAPKTPEQFRVEIYVLFDLEGKPINNDPYSLDGTDEN